MLFSFQNIFAVFGNIALITINLLLDSIGRSLSSVDIILKLSTYIYSFCNSTFCKSK